MPGRPRPLPDALPFPVFTTAEASRAGVSAPRLRAADLRSVDRGLWARASHHVTETDIVAALCRRDGDAFAIGLTAARLWGLPLPGVLDEEVVSPPHPARSERGRLTYRPRGRTVDSRIQLASPNTRRQGTALIRWSRLDVDPVLLGAMPSVRLTSRVRTLLDLAGLLRPEALVAIGDHLVRRPRKEFEGRSEPYMTLPELRRTADAFHGRGARTLREAVDRVRMSADSPAETRLRLAVVDAGLPEPVANARAVADPGASASALDDATASAAASATASATARAADGPQDLGEPDLHWPRWKVALEHDGPTHLSPKQQAKDITRGERRTRAGWIEVRTTAVDLHYGCRRAVSRVRDALERQGWRPT